MSLCHSCPAGLTQPQVPGAKATLGTTPVGMEEDSRVTLIIPAEATHSLQSSKSASGLVTCQLEREVV